MCFTVFLGYCLLTVSAFDVLHLEKFRIFQGWLILFGFQCSCLVPDYSGFKLLLYVYIIQEVYLKFCFSAATLIV